MIFDGAEWKVKFTISVAQKCGVGYGSDGFRGSVKADESSIGKPIFLEWRIQPVLLEMFMFRNIWLWFE